ncbi:hypothetical protein CALCODRAFT_556825 [Calocera cornea HHB12733]|uniref:Uncharacterized protein n=1 Tax=Calocera cornea HHB12733 TaxID=1353952 RepID=A0A165EDJ8_9BASI|nr:hypothetical protein CALCODRAFT_556825 [Calocera cornea HHB12733]
MPDGSPLAGRAHEPADYFSTPRPPYAFNYPRHRSASTPLIPTSSHSHSQPQPHNPNTAVDGQGPAPLEPGQHGQVPFQHPPYAHAYGPSLTLLHFLQPTRGFQLPPAPPPPRLPAAHDHQSHGPKPRLTASQARSHAFPAEQPPPLDASPAGSDASSSSKPSTPSAGPPSTTGPLPLGPSSQRKWRETEYHQGPSALRDRERAERREERRRARGYTQYLPGLPSPTFRTYFPGTGMRTPSELGSAEGSPSPSPSTSGSTSDASASAQSTALVTTSAEHPSQPSGFGSNAAAAAAARSRGPGPGQNPNQIPMPLAQLACFGPVLPRGLWDGPSPGEGGRRGPVAGAGAWGSAQPGEGAGGVWAASRAPAPAAHAPAHAHALEGASLSGSGSGGPARVRKTENERARARVQVGESELDRAERDERHKTQQQQQEVRMMERGDRLLVVEQAGPGIGRRARERREESRRRQELLDEAEGPSAALCVAGREGGREGEDSEKTTVVTIAQALAELTAQGQCVGGSGRYGARGARRRPELTAPGAHREREEGQAKPGERSVVTFTLPRVAARRAVAEGPAGPSTPPTIVPLASPAGSGPGEGSARGEPAGVAAGEGSLPREEDAPSRLQVADPDPPPALRPLPPARPPLPRSSTTPAPGGRPRTATAPSSFPPLAPLSPSLWVPIRHQHGGSWNAADLLRDVGEMRLQDLKLQQRRAREQEDRHEPGQDGRDRLDSWGILQDEMRLRGEPVPVLVHPFTPLPEQEQGQGQEQGQEQQRQERPPHLHRDTHRQAHLRQARAPLGGGAPHDSAPLHTHKEPLSRHHLPPAVAEAAHDSAGGEHAAPLAEAGQQEDKPDFWTTLNPGLIPAEREKASNGPSDSLWFKFRLKTASLYRIQHASTRSIPRKHSRSASYRLPTLTIPRLQLRTADYLGTPEFPAHGIFQGTSPKTYEYPHGYPQCRLGLTKRKSEGPRWNELRIKDGRLFHASLSAIGWLILNYTIYPKMGTASTMSTRSEITEREAFRFEDAPEVGTDAPTLVCVPETDVVVAAPETVDEAVRDDGEAPESEEDDECVEELVDVVVAVLLYPMIHISFLKQGDSQSSVQARHSIDKVDRIYTQAVESDRRRLVVGVVVL